MAAVERILNCPFLDAYERDNETGLDFAEARYFASVQGRFTSPDPLLSSGQVVSPQTWNRYTHSLNNPLRYIDPSGLYVFDKSVDEDMRKKFNAALDQARKDLEVIKKTYGENSSEYQKSKRALDIYGDLGQKNGVTIYARSQQAQGGETAVLQGTKTKDNPIGQDIRISIRKDAFDGDNFGGLIGHEGSHGADGSDWLKSGLKNSRNPTEYQFEFDGHFVQSVLGEVSVNRRKEAGGFASSWGYWQTSGNPPVQIEYYNTGWAEADKATIRRTNIDRWLAIPKSEGGSYGVTPSTKKKHF